MRVSGQFSGKFTTGSAEEIRTAGLKESAFQRVWYSIKKLREAISRPFQNHPKTIQDRFDAGVKPIWNCDNEKMG